MITLIHDCGARIEHEPAGLRLGGARLARFADSTTMDPVSECPRCGCDLAEALQDDAQWRLDRPTGQPIGAVKVKRKRGDVRAAAAKAIKKALREREQRRPAAKVAA